MRHLFRRLDRPARHGPILEIDTGRQDQPIIGKHLATRQRHGPGIPINADGEIYAYFSDQVQPQLLGQFNLVGFTNEKGLEATGSNLFLESPASGAAIVSTPGLDGLGTVRQGYLEESTVDSVREVTELIKAQRGYELNAKVITAADQMLSATTQVR